MCVAIGSNMAAVRATQTTSSLKENVYAHVQRGKTHPALEVPGTRRMSPVPRWACPEPRRWAFHAHRGRDADALPWEMPAYYLRIQVWKKLLYYYNCLRDFLNIFKFINSTVELNLEIPLWNLRVGRCCIVYKNYIKSRQNLNFYYYMKLNLFQIKISQPRVPK
jgi:hypothetical protein